MLHPSSFCSIFTALLQSSLVALREAEKEEERRALEKVCQKLEEDESITKSGGTKEKEKLKAIDEEDQDYMSNEEDGEENEFFDFDEETNVEHATLDSLSKNVFSKERMKEIEVLQETGLNESDEDPFDKIMNKKEHNGCLRLHGRGVCSKDLKGKQVKTSIVIALEFIDAIKSSVAEDMQSSLNAQKEKMEAELQAEKEKMSKVMDVELAKMQKELDTQKAKLADEVISNALTHLQKMMPNSNSEMITQTVALSVENNLTLQQRVSHNED